jgi:membrane-bound serine protease (ClpP class)
MPAKLARLLQLAPLAALGFGVAGGAQEPARGPSPTATVLTVRDAIGPATSDYLQRGIRSAAARGSALVVIELDTPGGLDTSMRDIIQAILASPVPVATFVYPPGARAASAGTYILYASHIAAMAPGTNVGAATPISIGGTPAPRGRNGDADERSRDERSADERGGDEDSRGERNEAQRGGDESPPAPEPAGAEERKAINDAVAYIRSLAEQRGRNADWAERAVRSAESLSARAALEAGVIDVVADDIDDLLAKLDDRRVTVSGGERTLDTETVVLERVDADWRTRLLAVITNPTIAYMLLLLGIYGLIFEGYNPGAILPGVVGAIALLLALYSLQLLPVNYAGLALLVLGIVLMSAELFVPSFGSLGFGGIAAFVFGSVILIDTDLPGYGLSTPLLVVISGTAAVALLGTMWLAMRSRRLPVVSGAEALLQSTAVAVEDFDREGAVRVNGERWRAVTAAPVHKGDELRVTAVDNLVLRVEPRGTRQQH